MEKLGQGEDKTPLDLTLLHDPGRVSDDQLAQPDEFARVLLHIEKEPQSVHEVCENLEIDVLGISLLDGFKQLALMALLEGPGLASSEESLNNHSTVILPP